MTVALENDDILSVRAWATLFDQASVNTFNYKVITITGGAITDQDLSNAVDILLATFYKSFLSVNSEYRGVQTYFRKRAAGFLPAPVKTITSAGNGTQPIPVAPPNTAAIFKYATNVRGPGGRGRIYLPFVSTNLVDGFGVPTTSLNVLINSLASALLLPLTITTSMCGSVFLAISLPPSTKRNTRPRKVMRLTLPPDDLNAWVKSSSLTFCRWAGRSPRNV